MRRQTQKHYGQDPGYYLICSEFCQEDGCGECSSLDEAVDRLGAYEDTGLMPEEIERSKMEIEAGCVKAIARTYGIDINRLRQLAASDRDGRLVALPCKVSDRLYEVTGRKTISVYKVRAIRVELFGLFIEWDIVEGFVWQSLSGINDGEIGKTVFLTREEAEKALEAMKDG